MFENSRKEERHETAEYRYKESKQNRTGHKVMSKAGWEGSFWQELLFI